MSGVPVSDPCVAALAHSPLTQDLQELGLHTASLSDPAIQALLTAPFLPQLTHLAIEKSDMQDATASQLCAAPLAKLRTISLFPARRVTEPMRQQLYRHFHGHFQSYFRPCACLAWVVNKDKEFIPAQKPAEWRYTGGDVVPSQFHDESGTDYYECEICGRHIQVDWLDRWQNEAPGIPCGPYTAYWVEKIDAEPPKQINAGDELGDDQNTPPPPA